MPLLVASLFLSSKNTPNKRTTQLRVEDRSFEGFEPFWFAHLHVLALTANKSRLGRALRQISAAMHAKRNLAWGGSYHWADFFKAKPEMAIRQPRRDGARRTCLIIYCHGQHRSRIPRIILGHGASSDSDRSCARQALRKRSWVAVTG